MIFFSVCYFLRFDMLLHFGLYIGNSFVIFLHIGGFDITDRNKIIIFMVQSYSSNNKTLYFK